MCRLAAMAVLSGCLITTVPAIAQNDWQFPDPYFGAIEFDISRPDVPRARRVAPLPPSRTKAVRGRSYRGRPRWSTQGTRP